MEQSDVDKKLDEWVRQYRNGTPTALPATPSVRPGLLRLVGWSALAGAAIGAVFGIAAALTLQWVLVLWLGTS
jgi:hypothetical protein